MRFPVLGGKLAMGFVSCRQMSVKGGQISGKNCMQTDWGCVRSPFISLHSISRNSIRAEGMQVGKGLFAGNVQLLSTWGRWNGLRPVKQWDRGIKARALLFKPSEIDSSVGIMASGELEQFSNEQVDELMEQLYKDAERVTQHAAYTLVQSQVESGEDDPNRGPPGPLELSIVLCDDVYIQKLNLTWRGIDSPTDVLAFEMESSETNILDADDDLECSGPSIDEQCTSIDGDGSLGGDDLPVVMLGDVIISLDTACCQARERGHTLLDECRILLVHGVLHLLGYDHELGEEEAEEMRQAEVDILTELGWNPKGLIESTTDVMHITTEFIKPRRDLKLLALDMDGTLLDSNSKILDSSVDAIKLALERQVQVILATGKARPAAIAAMEKVGLAGEGLVVSKTSAGIFLQGLAVYGPTGELVDGGTLEMDVVALVLRYAMEKDVGVCGFLGETCITPKMTTEIESLHSRYYEPLATIQPSVEQILSGPKIRKLLLMADSSTISNQIRPELEKKLRDTGATPVQAVDTMLEIVPRGWNKWRGMQGLLKHWEIPAEQVMAIGDGENDLELIKGVGLGVAMGNAVPLVKDVAKHVVSGNDMHGVAEAIEKYIL